MPHLEPDLGLLWVRAKAAIAVKRKTTKDPIVSPWQEILTTVQQGVFLRSIRTTRLPFNCPFPSLQQPTLVPTRSYSQSKIQYGFL
jgi:hypothetical protein